MAESKIKLYYFNSYGRGYQIRLCLHLGGIEFEDVRLSYEEFGKLDSEGYFKFG